MKDKLLQSKLIIISLNQSQKNYFLFAKEIMAKYLPEWQKKAIQCNL